MATNSEETTETIMRRLTARKYAAAAVLACEPGRRELVPLDLPVI